MRTSPWNIDVQIHVTHEGAAPIMRVTTTVEEHARVGHPS